jgi:hypothetical protein
MLSRIGPSTRILVRLFLHMLRIWSYDLTRILVRLFLTNVEDLVELDLGHVMDYRILVRLFL